MAAPDLKGSITALVTPFRDGAVDEDAFRRLVERQIAGGTHGLVPCGTTGESVTFSLDEHRRVAELCVEVAAGRVPVIAGAGANDTKKAIELVRIAKAAGADAALVVTPYYNKPSQDGLVAHYSAVADASDLPIVLYDVPSRTGVTMSVETVARIAERSTVVGIKDAVGDMVRPTLMRLACGPEFILLSGDDPSALGYMAHGGQGCISVTSNVAPEACASFQNACLQGDFASARQEHEQLIDLHRALFFDASPAPAKYALSELGLCTEEVRAPLLPCARAVRPQVFAAMRRAEVAA